MRKLIGLLTVCMALGMATSCRYVKKENPIPAKDSIVIVDTAFIKDSVVIGEWSRKNPEDADQIFIVELEQNGEANTENMAARPYTTWEAIDSCTILLRGTSMSNRRETEFVDTAVIDMEARPMKMRITGSSQKEEKKKDTEVVYTKE